jgi:ABC-2 type transport system permease protein
MRPRRILADLAVTAKGYYRSVVGLFFSLIFPIILIGLFGLIFSGTSSAPTLVVVNEDHNSNASQQFLAALGATQAVSVSVRTGISAANFSTWLASNQQDIGLVIPAGFESAYLNHTATNVTFYYNPGDAATYGAAAGALQAVANGFNLHAVHGTPIVGISQYQVGGYTYSYVDYLVPGLIGFSILTSPMFAMTELTASYRKDGLFRQLSLTPLTRAEYLLSKILWYTILTIASAAIMIAMGYFAFGIHIIFSPLILPFLVVGPFLFVSLGLLAASAAKTPESAAVLGNIITFPMMFLAGTFFPVSSFPAGLQAFAHVLPLYYVIDGLDAVMLYGNTARALLDLGIVFAIAVVIFVAAVWAFRWREE